MAFGFNQMIAGGTWGGLGLAFLIAVMAVCPPLLLPLIPRQDVPEWHVAAEIKPRGLTYFTEQRPS
jgi:hypothetical protein